MPKSQRPSWNPKTDPGQRYEWSEQRCRFRVFTRESFPGDGTTENFFGNTVETTIKFVYPDGREENPQGKLIEPDIRLLPHRADTDGPELTEDYLELMRIKGIMTTDERSFMEILEGHSRNNPIKRLAMPDLTGEMRPELGFNAIFNSRLPKDKQMSDRQIRDFKFQINEKYFRYGIYVGFCGDGFFIAQGKEDFDEAIRSLTVKALPLLKERRQAKIARDRKLNGQLKAKFAA
jgi:hypothetical protein